MGLVSGLERKNGWTLAEFAGEATPDGMQQLARVMIERVVAAGLPYGWVTGDEFYGGNGPLRVWLEVERI